MKISVIILLAAVAACHAAGTWKECKIEKSDVLLHNEDGLTDCAAYCPFMYTETEAKGYCKSYPSGYFCQCRLGTHKNTHQSCKVIDVHRVVDNADGLDTCEAWCRETEKTNTGTCIPYITGWYCDCH